jgi:small subunit ribosomal protein S16
MSTRIRLRRMGSNKRPFYRVVVADQRSPRDGRFIENIGKYHPLSDPSLIEIDEERAIHWLRVGAQPSNQVRILLQRVGVWDRFVAERPRAAEGLKVREGGKPEKPKLSKKAQAKAAEPEPAPAAPEPPAAETPAPEPEPEAVAPAPEAAAPEPETAAEPDATPPEPEATGPEPEAGPPEETVEG